MLSKETILFGSISRAEPSENSIPCHVRDYNEDTE
jgi:hypothetical protein